MKVVVAHGKASWMQQVLEKMEASSRVIPLLRHYPVSTEPEWLWEYGNVMLGFDAEERLLIQKLPYGRSGAVAQCQSSRGADRAHDGAERRQSIRYEPVH